MTDSPRPTIHVIDDDASVRRGLRRLLRASGVAVEEYPSAEAFLERGPVAGTGCLVLDIRMPRLSGIDLFERLSRRGGMPPVIFLTAHGDVPTSVRAMKGGAVDFLLKPVDADALLGAIEAALERHARERMQEHARTELAARLARLSPREREVMDRVVRGAPNKAVAADLGISEKTVKVHRHRVMEKMEASSLAELVRTVAPVLDATSEPALS